jgi:hypothetical protein
LMIYCAACCSVTSGFQPGSYRIGKLLIPRHGALPDRIVKSLIPRHQLVSCFESVPRRSAMTSRCIAANAARWRSSHP